jgi:hypothetical protein
MGLLLGSWQDDTVLIEHSMVLASCTNLCILHIAAFFVLDRYATQLGSALSCRFTHCSHYYSLLELHSLC